MKPTTIFSALALLLTVSTVQAREALSVRGVFCNSEAQILAVEDHILGGMAPHVAAEMMNRDEVVCVYADRIDYVVERPAIIDEIRDGGTEIVAYQATLTGVRVGDNLRPIDPPLPIFFITPERIEGAVFLGSA